MVEISIITDSSNLNEYDLAISFVLYGHLPKEFVQTQISTHNSSHLSAYHRKYTLNEVTIR